jgi:hypothetical protein
VVSGVVQVLFTVPFPTGYDYVLSVLWGLDAEGNKMDAIPYDLTVDGFKVNFQVGVTFDYMATVKR